MPIVNPTKAQVEEYLAKIGWSIRHHGCGHYYFYNHKKKCTGLLYLFPDTDPRLEIEGKNHQNPSLVFYLKDCQMELLDNNCVSFRGINDKGIFILCPNYDKPNAT